MRGREVPLDLDLDWKSARVLYLDLELAYFVPPGNIALVIELKILGMIGIQKQVTGLGIIAGFIHMMFTGIELNTVGMTGIKKPMTG